jgi:hypothetical protein
VRVPREVAVHLLHNGGYVVHKLGSSPTLQLGSTLEATR